MYTEMVARRGYSLSRYVDLVSTNAAKIMGLYPRKGAIAPGSDADITILDPARRGKVRAADLHETDYTPWEGHDIFAWPVVTILRGKVMVEKGEYFASPNDGRYLKRKISQQTLSGARFERRPRRSGLRAAGRKPRRVAGRRRRPQRKRRRDRDFRQPQGDPD